MQHVYLASLEDEPTPAAGTPDAAPPASDAKDAGAVDEPALDVSHPHELQGPMRFSKSLLWDLMRSFYERKGVEAWSKGIVPFFITCNAHIAQCYARVIHGYLRDLMVRDDLCKGEPIYVVELGAGSGKFSFLLLKALLERQECLYGRGQFAPFRLKYVMTDFTASNFDFWSKHPALQRYLHAGLLDFGQFDGAADSSVFLQREQRTLAPGSLGNPLILVANYLFDTLPADAFQLRDGGQLHEGMPSVRSPSVEPDRLDPDILKRFAAPFEYRPVDAEEYYKDEVENTSSQPLGPHLARILRWYSRHFPTTYGKLRSAGESEAAPMRVATLGKAGRVEVTASSVAAGDASLLLPIVSLRCLNRLACLPKHGRMMVVSGDKGHSSTDAFLGLHDPHIAVHGSFSLMVNYHALGLWFDSRGGFALHSTQQETSLQVSAFVLDSCPDFEGDPLSRSFEDATHHWDVDGKPLQARTQRFRSLCVAFSDTVEKFGPDDFFHLQKGAKEERDSLARARERAETEAAGEGARVVPPTSREGWAEQSLKSIMALLKLQVLRSDWDPDLMFKFRDAILDKVGKAGPRLKTDMTRGMERVWANYYLLDTERDIAFEVARFYYGTREYAKALVFYAKSTEQIGRHHVTEHNMGLCHYNCGSKRDALVSFRRAMDLDATYAKARQWHERVSRELEIEEAEVSGSEDKERLLSVDESCRGGRVTNGESPLPSALTHRVSVDPEVQTRLSAQQGLPLRNNAS